jgi:hypothetical protein
MHDLITCSHEMDLKYEIAWCMSFHFPGSSS